MKWVERVRKGEKKKVLLVLCSKQTGIIHHRVFDGGQEESGVCVCSDSLSCG